MADNARWLDLSKRVTASERVYQRLGDEAWQSFDVTTAIRYRGLAEGLAMARDHQLEVSQQPRILDPDPMDGAMHSVWLHADWRFLTRKMTTEQRELAADAVQRYSDWLTRQDDEAPNALPDLRWWRDA